MDSTWLLKNLKTNGQDENSAHFLWQCAENRVSLHNSNKKHIKEYC